MKECKNFIRRIDLDVFSIGDYETCENCARSGDCIKEKSSRYNLQ